MNSYSLVIPMSASIQTKCTNDPNYSEGLINRQNVWWKKLFGVQIPYRRNIRRLQPGFVLDVGCGIGRNLLHLDGNGVGVDHNEKSVEICKQRGLTAFTVEEFLKSEYNVVQRFDSILLAHVAEHMTEEEFANLLQMYIPLLKDNGRIIVITPQENGFKSDNTHIQFMDFNLVKKILTRKGLHMVKQYSFPFPRIAGHFFRYNEFVSIASRK